MAATRSAIKRWYEEGVAQGASYMIVFCDTYDHSDYPSYYTSRDDAQKSKDNPGSMQRVMEVYDLNGNKEDQLNTHRAMAL